MFSKDLKIWQWVNRWLDKSNKVKSSSMLTEMSLGIYIQERVELSVLIIYKLYLINLKCGHLKCGIGVGQLVFKLWQFEVKTNNYKVTYYCIFEWKPHLPFFKWQSSHIYLLFPGSLLGQGDNIEVLNVVRAQMDFIYFIIQYLS